MPTRGVPTLDLRRLFAGQPRLTPSVGGSYAEAAARCLEYNSLQPKGTTLDVQGDYTGKFRLDWKLCTAQSLASHYDGWDAAEDGACGIAVLLVERILRKHVVKRTWKGTASGVGFDYWLADKGTETTLPGLEGDLRMEVSGLLQGSNADFKARVKEKVEQVKKGMDLGPGVAVVVNFKQPIAKMVNA